MMVKFGGIFVLFLSIFVQSGLAIVCYNCTYTNDLCGLPFDDKINNYPTKTCSSSTTNCLTQLIEVESSGENDKPGYHTLRGCSEDLVGDNCSDEQKCKFCNEDKCNNQAIGANRLQCHKCSGDCKTTVKGLCNVLPGPNPPFNFESNCITLFDKDGKVSQRGCYGDMSMVTRKVCDDANNYNCIKCNTTDCNTHSERVANKCYQCSGEECKKSSGNLLEVTCSNGNATNKLSTECFVGTNKSGQFVRDCKEKIGNDFDFKNCSTIENKNEYTQCITCSGELCNNQEFPIKKILSCYTCKGDCSDSTIDPATAKNCSTDAKECVTIFSNGKVIERGCSTSETNQTCVTNTCRHCSTDNNCNSHTTQNINCLQCNSSAEPNCVYNTSLLAQQTVPCSDYCFTKIEGVSLIRGCLQQAECLDSVCKKCDSDNCNKDDFPNDRLSCYKCSGAECESNQKTERCLKYSKTDQCFSQFSEYNLTKKGCQSDFTEVENKNCIDSPVTCNLCQGPNCNHINTRSDEKCVICNSRLSPECAQKPNVLPQTQCDKKSNGKCFSALTGMFTVRRCFSDINMEGISPNATAECTGQGCNNKIYPEDRLKCYQCDSNKDSNCKNKQDDTTLSIPCVNYMKEDGCFSIINDADELHRGCSSSVLGDVCTKTKKCRKCTGNACNSISEQSLNSSVINKVNGFIILFVLLITSNFR
jgi:hypothetical protein